MSWKWRAGFTLEAALLLVLCGHWLWAPGAHLGRLLGLAEGEGLLLALAHLSTAALCAWTWLYIRVLAGGAEPKTFRRIQEALALAHILLLAAGMGIAAELNPEPTAWLGFTLVHLAGLGIRITYLVMTREVPWSGKQAAPTLRATGSG